jgi:hypothetical protein
MYEVIKMSSTEIKTVITKCDVCDVECEPLKEISIPFSYSGEFVNNIKLDICAYIPYGTANGDVCPDCFKKHIKKWLDSNA